MSKLKRHGYAERLKYMQMLEQGYGVNYIHCHYGINAELLRSLWTRYQGIGYQALIKSSNARLSPQEKLEAIQDFEIKNLSLNDVLLKYGISEAAFGEWRKRYHAVGAYGLTPRKIGRPSKDMGKVLITLVHKAEA